jgi:SAM-dependent methyltransferase
MSRDSPPPLFDAYAQQYELAVRQGLDLTGEEREYYAHGRVSRLGVLLAGAGERPCRILDYGCGTGGAITALQETFATANICGTDVSEVSLELARAAYPSAQFERPSEAQNAGPFDLCHCNGVFHHIPPTERDACLTQIHRCLRPGGWFALFENNPLNPGTRLVMSRIPFDRDAVTLPPWESVRRLRGTGFRVETVEYLFYFPRSLARLRPLERFLYHVPLGGQYLVLAQREAT